MFFTDIEKSTTPVLTESQEEGWTIYGGIPSNNNDTFLRDLCRFTRPLWILAIAADLIVMGWKNNDMSPEQLAVIGMYTFIWHSVFKLIHPYRSSRTWFYIGIPG